MKERRLLPRWEIKKEVRVWLQGVLLREGFIQGMIEDMHLKGMRVALNKRLPRLQTMSMTFAIGDKFDFITIDIKVPWDKEELGRYVYGLSFSQINEDDRRRMYEYINSHCYGQFENKNWGGGQ